MPIGEISGAVLRPGGLPAHGGKPESAGHAAESRALVALTPAAAAHATPAHNRQAAFLAHLLAMKGQHPQTRERRRAEPNEALAAYRATATLVR